MKLRANGIEIHYELVGSESAPMVTFSHSLLTNLAMWDPQIAALDNYRVLRFDTLGHGQSEATPGAYDFELLADDAQSLLNRLGIQKTHFVGLSMGGMIGQELVLKYPERIASLVLCDTRGHSPPQRSKARTERIATARRHGIEPMVERALEGWFSDVFRQRNLEIMDVVRQMIRSTSVDGLIGCTHAIDVQDHTPRLHEISVPTLIIVGEDDRGTPVSESRDMHERISGSELVVLPTARHLSNMERSQEFNQALLTFLGKIRSSYDRLNDHPGLSNGH
jgi:3-oxoadipate enol-lactonase